MKKTIAGIEKAIMSLTDIMTMFAGVGFLITAFIISYEIVMRAAFNEPTEWSLELSVYLVLIGGFLGMAATYRDGKHIRLDLITDRLPKSWQTYFSIVAGIGTLVFGVIFFIESIDMVATSYQMERTSTSTLRVPLYLPQLALPIGGLFLVLQVIRKMVLDICQLRQMSGQRQENKL